jgi:hypothetical protein
MTPDSLVVWKFESAPQELRALYTGESPPRWVALVPAAIHGPDLQQTIERQTGIQKFDTASGDVVYIGVVDVIELLDLVGTLTESSTADSLPRPASA